MTIGGELITSAACSSALFAILGYMMKRWIERVDVKQDKVFEKLDKLMKELSANVPRREYEHGIQRLHIRLDETSQEISDVSKRVVRVETIMEGKQ